MGSLYILEIKPLFEISLADVFSHPVDSLLILLMFLLAVQKLFILIRSCLFILSFMSFAVGDMLVKILLRGISLIFVLICLILLSLCLGSAVLGGIGVYT